MSCGCNTKKGEICSRSAQEASKYCWQHQEKVAIYTLPTCPYSINAKKLLKKYHMNYREIDVSNSQDKQSLIKKTGHRTMPQIFIQDEFIGGYDDLVTLLE